MEFIFSGITLFGWVILAVMAIFAIAWVAMTAQEVTSRYGAIRCVIIAVVCICIILATAAGMSWYHTKTASGIRSYKDYKSEMTNGATMYREIAITAEDGREIFHYEGHFDMERRGSGDDRYIRFEAEDGKRYTIMYGVQDTVLVIEK